MECGDGKKKWKQIVGVDRQSIIDGICRRLEYLEKQM
jgi:hypothetical protein